MRWPFDSPLYNAISLYGAAGADTLRGSSAGDSLYGAAGNDTLQGGAGNDSLSAGDDDDLVEGGVGNDLLVGSGGNDTYRFSLGDGQDVVREIADFNSGWGGYDTIQFEAGITPDMITVAQADYGQDLILAIDGTGDQITIDQTMVSGDYRIEQVRFADGTVWTHEQLVQMSNQSGGMAMADSGSSKRVVLLGDPLGASTSEEFANGLYPISPSGPFQPYDYLWA